MYRLSGPNIIIFLPLFLIGIITVAFSPHYLIQSRIVSFGSLLIGEIGLSFIPVIALFPKASLIQAAVLASIYMLTTIATCFAAWGINSFGWPGEFSFVLKGNEFTLNTYALFIANIFSFFLLVTNYRLTFDEELGKERSAAQHKRGKGFFSNLTKPKLNRPVFTEGTPPSLQGIEKPKTQKFKSSETKMDEEFWKPFEFEPEINKSSETLPEESSGMLFSKKTETEEKKKESEFFDDEESGEKFIDPFSDFESSQKPIEKPKPIKISPLPPSNIKEELGAIFEQYSSLDAVKKITSSKSDKEPKKEPERKSRQEIKKPYSLPKPQIQMSVKVEESDIHEASFRQISEAEKIEEIKESLKKELEEELKLKMLSESSKEVQKEIIEPKENIIESIKNIKEELIESLKSEIKKEFSEIESQESQTTEPKAVDFSEEELEIMDENLKDISTHEQVSGSIFLSYHGNVLSQNWNSEEVKLSENANKEISLLFNQANKQINKTKQGSLLHILLESEKGSLIVADSSEKLLAVQSKGTGEVYLGQLLRKLSELEE